MRRRTRVLLLLALVAAGVGVRLLSDAPPTTSDGAGRTMLRPWSLLGCWEVRLTSWTATPATTLADSGADRGARRRRGRREAEQGRRSGGGATIPASTVPPTALEPPTAVMLLPDSVDLWGRVLGSYRAVPIEEGRPIRAAVGEAARSARTLRWFTAGDTLWLIWTDDAARAGVALVPHDGHLRGRARALADSTDVSAGAEAWPVNCSTGERESPFPWRER